MTKELLDELQELANACCEDCDDIYPALLAFLVNRKIDGSFMDLRNSNVKISAGNSMCVSGDDA